MSDGPEYVYIMYPIPIDEVKKLPIFKPVFQPVSLPEEESFVPLWFGTARFPEDDLED